MTLNFIWYYTVQIPRQNVLASVVGKYVAIDNADNPIPKIPIRYNINTFFNKIFYFILQTRILSFKVSELPLPIIKIESHKLNP